MRRGIKVRLVAFVLLSAVSLLYVGGSYLGVVDRVLGRGLTITAELPGSGGLFEGSEVTYRGVKIGEVARMEPTREGLVATLELEEGTRLPLDSPMFVHNLSAVGEQYLDFEPASDEGPYAEEGDVMTGTAESLPVDEGDLLVELDKMEFFVYETGETIKAKHRPIIIITSNNEKELPDAFLRRCFFHFINFPSRETMEKIVAVHHPDVKKELVNEALEVFFDVRSIPGLKKKPSTSELIDWLKLLMADDVPDEILKNRDSSKAIPPLYGALLKNEQDVHLLERLAFMPRRESRGQLIC